MPSLPQLGAVVGDALARVRFEPAQLDAFLWRLRRGGRGPVVGRDPRIPVNQAAQLLGIGRIGQTPHLGLGHRSAVHPSSSNGQTIAYSRWNQCSLPNGSLSITVAW